MYPNNKPAKVGDCESCTRTNVILTPMHGGKIDMCDECIASEKKATQERVQSIVRESQSIDSSVKLDTQLFNAPTVAIIELQSAIQQDDSIPADKKNVAYIELCAERHRHFSSIIFEREKELDVLRNERTAWQVAIQTTAAKLRSDERAKYKEFDLNYTPVVKTIKSPRVPSTKPTKVFSKQALADAAKKYDIPMVGIQSLVVSRNLSVEDAAIQLAKLMGKL